jgi:hypothetical protein
VFAATTENLPAAGLEMMAIDAINMRPGGASGY